ncbi:MAG: hypothetical protein BWK76_16980 [Desulfobulbaceae bacterium A2]|nr:MAG: hypothetical protein BWK76_16980 [Desulfobulbaceae bacterium A2]
MCFAIAKMTFCESIMLKGNRHIAKMVAGSLEADTPSVRDLVEIAVQDYVRASGHRVIGTGSWVTGEGYRCPLHAPDPSDHDMTPLFEHSNDHKEILQAWRSMQVFVRRRLVEQLALVRPRLHPRDNMTVLSSVNIFPPDELMGEVGDEQAACRFFDRFGITPNLGEGRLDGVWGAGSKAFLAACGRRSGVVFYRDQGGGVQRGTTNPGLWLSGADQPDFLGTLTLCEQFLGKARQALRDGRGAETCKNLQRLSYYLLRAEQASGLGRRWLESSPLDAIIDEALTLHQVSLDALQGWLGYQRHRLEIGLVQAGIEIDCLRDMTTNGTVTPSLG